MTSASTCTLREYSLLTDEATVNVAYVVVEIIIFVVIVIGSLRELLSDSSEKCHSG